MCHDIICTSAGSISEQLGIPADAFSVFANIFGKRKGLSEETGMAEEMGMTNKQFQGFVKLILECVRKALDRSPDNNELIRLQEILQSMLEDA